MGADDLMRDYATFPRRCSPRRRAGAQVVFSGEGDEVFAGYGRYRASRLERWAKGMIAPDLAVGPVAVSRALAA
jgi:asparagine synthase (glutamine-hydrolysing)